MSDSEPAENGAELSKASATARVLFGLFIIWASFYLVAVAERISDNGARKRRPLPAAGQTSAPPADLIESHPQPPPGASSAAKEPNP